MSKILSYSRPDPECPENSHWEKAAPICFPSCKNPYEYDYEEHCKTQFKGMCVCEDGFFKERPNPKAKCVTLETCFANVCRKDEKFSSCVPKCFDDCRSRWYDNVNQPCHDWASEDCKIGRYTIF